MRSTLAMATFAALAASAAGVSALDANPHMFGSLLVPGLPLQATLPALPLSPTMLTPSSARTMPSAVVRPALEQMPVLSARDMGATLWVAPSSAV